MSTDWCQAKAHYTRAIEAYREIGAPFGEGNSLTGLGDALLAEGDPEGAERAWHQSVDILDRLPHPLADEVRAKLRGLQADKHRRQEHPGTAAPGPAGPGEMNGAATAAR